MAESSVSSVKCLGGVVLPSLTAGGNGKQLSLESSGGCCHLPFSVVPSNPYEGLFPFGGKGISAAVQPCLGLQIDEGCADRHKHLTGNKARISPFAYGQGFQVRFSPPPSWERRRGGHDILLLHLPPNRRLRAAPCRRQPRSTAPARLRRPPISSVRKRLSVRG